MKIVCDANVLVRAAINPNRLAGELLKKIRGAHTLLLSLPVLAETLAVLRRPKIQRLHGLDDKAIRRFISSLYKAATVVNLPQPIPPEKRLSRRTNPSNEVERLINGQCGLWNVAVVV